MKTIQERVARIEKELKKIKILLASRDGQEYHSDMEMRKKGGEARAAILSPERRKEIAAKAAAARWKK